MRLPGLNEKSETLVDRTLADKSFWYRKSVMEEQARNPRVAIGTIARSILDAHEKVS